MSLKKTLETFYIVVPVGFEDLLVEEILNLQPWIIGPDMLPSTQIIEISNRTKGGVEVITSKEVGFLLNHLLKTPVRILWRWKSKKISHVSEMKSWIRSLRPQDYLEGSFRLQISAKKSRLQNEKMLHRVFAEDWKQVDDSAGSTLFVDVYDDQMTLSWDTTGEALYKRGWAEQKGPAPIRENLAHLLLMDLTRGMTGPELQNYQLVDPMMGSGTFLLESLGWNYPVLQRQFQYQNLKSVPNFLRVEWWKNHARPSRSLFGSHVGADQSSVMVDKAKSNLSPWLTKNQVELKVEDLLKTQSTNVSSIKKILISNPPYGERIQVQSLTELLKQAIHRYQPVKALFVIPKEYRVNIPGYSLIGVREFSNGGLDVKSVIFSRDV